MPAGIPRLTAATETRMFARYLFLLCASAFATGCATMHPRAHAEALKVTTFGEATVARQAKRDFQLALHQAVDDLSFDQLVELEPTVKIVERTFPPGVELKDGLITASPDSGFEVTATFRYSPPDAYTFWFADYDSIGRKVFCYPQVPLTWVTLSAWQFFVPLSFPCMTRTVVPVDNIYGLVRQAAKSAGADLVVLTNVYSDGEMTGGLEGVMLRFIGIPAPAPAPQRMPDI